MAKTGPTRRERQKKRDQKDILDAALRLFTEKGFYNVSMHEIAAASEFGVGTLYNFFESKEALFDELIKDGSERIISEFSEILDRPFNAADRLSAFISQQPQLQHRYGELIKLHLSVFGIKGSRLTRVKDENLVHREINPKLVSLIDSGIREGLFRPVDPEITARALGAAIEALIFETAVERDNREVTGMFRALEQLFLDGLLKPE